MVDLIFETNLSNRVFLGRILISKVIQVKPEGCLLKRFNGVVLVKEETDPEQTP